MFQVKIPKLISNKLFHFPATLIILFSMELNTAANYETGIKSGISREVLNYEKDNPQLVIRNGLFLNFYKSFIFEFTSLRNINEDTFSYTWNMTLKNVSGFMDFTAGNFNLHYGSGLMMGKKSYSASDPFSKKITISKSETISPSNGGNPEYSLYGIATDFHLASENMKIYLIPFFSIQRRYIFKESSENGCIESSLFTLNTKAKPDKDNTEPVYIINYGGVFGFRYIDMLNTQLYYFETDLKGDEGRDILWDTGKYNTGKGIDLIRNSGFFTEYADRNISIFIEPALSTMICEETITGYAITYGLGIKNSIMNFNVKGKNSGLNFHSENSSGSRTPERICEMRSGVFPLSFIETGFALYSCKNLTPAYNKNYIDGTIQEEVFACINTGTIELDLGLKRSGHYSSDREITAEQGSLNALLKFSERFFFKTKYSAQKNSDNISHLYGSEIKLLFHSYFCLSLGYTGIRINGDVPFYAVITPASEHSSVICFRESSHGGSLNFRYKKEMDSFYARFTLVRSGTERSGEIESALVLVF